MLLLLKNQKLPLSPVSETAWPVPDVPWLGTRQLTCTLKRELLRHSTSDPAVHGRVPAPKLNTPYLVAA